MKMSDHNFFTGSNISSSIILSDAYDFFEKTIIIIEDSWKRNQELIASQDFCNGPFDKLIFLNKRIF
jgi:hypothetical protein